MFPLDDFVRTVVERVLPFEWTGSVCFFAIVCLYLLIEDAPILEFPSGFYGINSS